GWRDTRQRRVNDTDYSRRDILGVDYAERYRQWSSELRLLSPDSGRMRYLGGVQMLAEDAAAQRLALIGRDMDAVVPLPGGASAPIGAALRIEAGGSAAIASRIRTRSFGLFGGVDYDLSARLTLSAGLRYTDDDRRLRHDL